MNAGRRGTGKPAAPGTQPEGAHVITWPLILLGCMAVVAGTAALTFFLLDGWKVNE